ncbi:MAG: nucleotidyltransferase domain-containing protein [Candidatus Aenigmarchaeota archaeon]|nr:nucleotidyltransferase domain-containing protein [Candidatus Aenigmarchaeota archaeon]
MQFRDFACNLMGSKIKILLLQELIRSDVIGSERETARILGVSNAAVSKSLKSFQDANFIKSTRIGTAFMWSVNKESYAYDFINHIFEKWKDGDTPLKDLRRELLKLQTINEVRKAIIFGSVSEENDMPESDIDLFVLVDRENDKLLNMLADLDNRCLRRYGNKLSFIIYTPKKFESEKNKKLLENIKTGIVVLEK